ncbi:MAG: diacylglycerol kinase family lipid kinase, partial [Candidatus Nomurabacteria bacterium]|nr:diacylglycerol kinase family lipid kinase [Candidatus Nomurabacteria bacterium]
MSKVEAPEYIFIVNPVAGRGQPNPIIERIHNVCRRRGLNYRVETTTHPKHATEITKSLPKSGKIVFAVGGDGTLNEVLNGLMGTKNILGVIPDGTGNDFYDSLKRINQPRPKIDVGVVNGKHYYINSCGCGIDTEVSLTMTNMRNKKFIPASQRYPLAIAKAILTFRAMRMEFSLGPGKSKSDRFMIVSASNGRQVGGEYLIAPSADLQDGKLDICFAEKISKLRLPPLIGALKSGKHGEDPNVHLRQTSHLKLKSPREITMNLDGEF